MSIKTNRLVGALLVLAMLLTTVLPSFAALAAGTAQVTLVSSAMEALKPGDEFTVTPTLANNPGFAGVTWKLEYDNTALELTNITADGRKAGHLFGYGTFASNVDYGNNNLVYANATCETEDGELCALTFKVRDNAAAGDYTVSVAKSDADFKFVALDSINVDVNFTPCTVTVGGAESEYKDAYLAYCKGTAGAYEFLPVGDTLYINNYAKVDGAKELIAEYKLAVVNNGEIVSEMSEDKWTVDGNVFKTAVHSASDPDGVLTVNATGKLEDAVGTLTATLPDGTALSTNVHVTKTPWKITANGVDGLSKDQYRSANSSIYAFIGDSFKFTYALQTATNGSIKGTNVKLSFASSNAKAATVAEDGTITAIGEGIAQISVKAVAYNYGAPTEIELLNTLNVYVDKGFVTNFVLTDVDGNVRTENIKNASGYTVPQLTMTAGEEITLNVKAMPGMTDAECAGTIASQKQFTVSTNKTALTATTVDTNTVTLKAANVTADMTVTVKSPQYYRSKVNSSNPWAEQFTLTVNVKAPSGVESVALDKTSMNLVLCDGYNTGKLTATVNPETVDQGVVWSSDNEEIATVSDDGTVTAVAAGTANVTAKSTLDESKTASCEITVTEEVKLTSISWSIDTANSELQRVNKNSSAYVYVVDRDADAGKKIVMKATYKPENATNKTLKAVEWALKGTNVDTIASIDEYGTVTWKGGFGKVELNGKVPYNGTTTTKVQTLHFTPGLATAAKVMKNGEEVTETIVVKPGDTITFNAAWDVTNEAYAPEYQWVRLTGDGSDNNKFSNLTANGDLEITPEKLTRWGVTNPGDELTLQLRVAIYQSAVKNATSDTDTVKKTFVLKLAPAVENVALNESALSLNIGDTVTLTATVEPADADQAVVWSTSDSNVATVENGVVTAVGAGAATIKATSASDETKSAECEVTVAAKPDYSNAYLAVRLGKGTEADPYTYKAIGDETVYLNAHGAVAADVSWTGDAGFFAMLDGKPIEDVEWALENKDNAQIDTLNENQYKPGVCVNARASGGKLGSNALIATLPDNTKLTAKLEMVYLATKISLTGLNGADGFNSWQVTNQHYDYVGTAGDTFTPAYNLLYQNSIMKDADKLATNKVTFRSMDESVATVDENGKVTLTGDGTTQVYVVISMKLGHKDQADELRSVPINVYSGNYAKAYNWYLNGEKQERDYDLTGAGKYIYTKTSVVEGRETEFTVKAVPDGAPLKIKSASAKDASILEVTVKDDTTLVVKGLKEATDLTSISIEFDRTSGDFQPNGSWGNIYLTVEKAPDYSNAYLAYCKGGKTAYEFIPVGDTIYINNWANGANFIQEYRIAVVNNGEIVADMPNENWAVENKDDVFMNAYHNSSDPDGVFYINAHGKAEGATGSITATLPDGKALSANVVVTESASKVTINGVEGLAKSHYSNYSAFPAIDDTFKFTYVLYNASNNKVAAANTKFIFKSSNTDVVTVDENNALTAIGEGSAQITVFEQVYCYGEPVEVEVAAKTYTNTAYKINVYVDPNYVDYFALVDANDDVQGTYAENAYGYVQPTLTLKAGEEITLWPKGMPGKTELVCSGTTASSKAFKLQSGGGVTVTTNEDGSVTLKADNVTENATAAVRSPGFYRSAANKKAASSFDTNVVVNALAAVESIELKATLTLKEGASEQLTATVMPADANQEVKWTSDNEEVATVSKDGTVTAVAAGTATITATSAADETKTAACEVTVTAQPRVEGLTALLGCDQTSVKVGEEIEVNLYVDSDNAEETYNAFQFGVNFSDNLEYLGSTGLNTESDYNYVDVNGSTVTISGFGASKTVSGENALVTLRFKAKAAGEAKVTLPENAAFANGKSVAVSDDLQAIKVLNNEVILNVKKSFEIPVTGGTVDGGKTTIPATEGESTSFKPDAPADGKQIDEVRVNGEKVAPNEDGSYTIPNPTEDTTVEIVINPKTYTVTITGTGAGDASGEAIAKHGQPYRFTINKDADYNYTVSATAGGKAVSVTGEYEIAGEDVTGNIAIVINKEKKSQEETMRSVTAYLNGADAKEMAKVAKDAQSYAFTNPYAKSAKPYKATVNGAEVDITAGANGSWTISGPFAGDVEIFFGGVYNVTKPADVTGEATAEYLKDYSFTVPAARAEGKPSVTIGGAEYALANGTADADGNATYVISGADITGDIVITLPEPAAQVNVNLYFKAEDKSGTAYNVYLVTAKAGAAMPAGKVFAYDGTAMFWSEEYQAFAYLVSVNGTFSAEEATKHVAMADGDKASKTVDYTGDVNMSDKVDLNDAQLVYDLYNANYHDFSVVSMEKMLRADVSKDKQIDVSDVTAIVTIVRK